MTIIRACGANPTRRNTTCRPLPTQPPPTTAPPPLPAALVFDACNVGVVLRAVLFVEAVVGVGAMFGTSQFVEWLLRFSLLTGGVLPATLAWLIGACLLKTQVARIGNLQQWLAYGIFGSLRIPVTSE